MSTKKHSIEYRLLIKPTYDDTLKKAGFLFLLETSMQFTSFSYIIDVREKTDGKTINWSLHGLRTPSMNMPSTGTAQFSKVYFDLDKNVSFTLVKKGSVEAVTDVKFLKSGVVSSNSVSNFLKIYTDEALFEKNRTTDADIPEPKPDTHRNSAEIKKQIKKKKKD